MKRVISFFSEEPDYFWEWTLLVGYQILPSQQCFQHIFWIHIIYSNTSTSFLKQDHLWEDSLLNYTSIFCKVNSPTSCRERIDQKTHLVNSFESCFFFIIDVVRSHQIIQIHIQMIPCKLGTKLTYDNKNCPSPVKIWHEIGCNGPCYLETLFHDISFHLSLYIFYICFSCTRIYFTNLH